MEWETDSYTGDQECRGELGFWVVKDNSMGQGLLGFAPKGVSGVCARDFAICGSMAEARLLAALYELDAAEPLGVEEQMAEFGFGAPRVGDRVAVFGMASPPGTLEVAIHGPKENGERSVSARYVQKNGHRWNTIVQARDIRAMEEDFTDNWRPNLPYDPFLLDVKAALAVSAARLAAHGDHRKPLADGEERPFVDALAEARANAPSGFRP